MMRFNFCFALLITIPIMSQAQSISGTYHCMGFESAEGIFVDVDLDAKTFQVELHRYHGNFEVVEPTPAKIIKYEKSGDFIYAQSELDLEPWPQRVSYFFDPNDYRLYVSHVTYTSKILVTTNVFDCINTQYIKTFRRQ